MANQPSLTSLQIFDKSIAARCGSVYGVNRNDTINSVTFEFARVPISSLVNFGSTVTTAQGRTVRAAIWNMTSGWSVNRQPDFISSNEFNTNSIELWNTNESSQKFTAKTFSFSNCQIKDSDAVVIGLISEPKNAKVGQLCVRKNVAGSMIYGIDLYPVGALNATDNGCGTITGSLYIKDIQITPYSNEDKPTVPELSVSYISSRTLSASQDPSILGKDYPRADLDSQVISATTKINSYSTQWDTKYSNHPWAGNAGYDIPIGKLTATCHNDGNTQTFSPSNPYWVFTRSRVMFTFNSWNATGYSTIEYTISGGKSNTANVYKETKGRATSLLICLRDEGVTDCSAMAITFTRKTYADTGTLRGVSKPITIYFQTYADPQVTIAYPKPIKDDNGVNHNYVLWATDVVPNIYNEDRKVTSQICSALNMLLSKDGGDNSGIPIFTRIYIAEYKGEYGSGGAYDGTFPTPSNAAIENGLTYTASWRGIQLDDGTLFQLSGMKKGSFTWDDGASDDDHRIASSKSTYIQDKRLIFRAGYKYLIKVRRFHGAAAGAAASGKYNINQLFGGDYSYLDPNQLTVEATYPGADNSGSYPSNDSASWINSNNIDYAYKRWVGPSDGSSGVKLSDATNLDKVYPGFSKSDHIIIDCVDSMTSRSNIVVTRPGTQEIGADHWLTFAYKHLNKTNTGVDHSVYASSGNASKQNEINIASLKADGSVDAVPGLPNYVYGSTWSGYDNTATRIGKMYKAIVKQVLAFTSCYWTNIKDTRTAPYIDITEEDYSKTHTFEGPSYASINIQVIPKEGDNGNNLLTLYHNEKYNFESEPIAYDPGDSNNQIWGDNVLDNYLRKKQYPTDNSTMDLGQQYIFYNDKPDAANTEVYGNTYKWYPMVAATGADSSGNPPSLLASSQYDSNNMLDHTILDKANYDPVIATKYTPSVADKYQPKINITAGANKEKPNTDGLKHWQEWNNSENTEDENSSRDGHLFVSASAAFPANIEGEGKTFNSSGTGGTQLFSYNSNNCEQAMPGKLFKRISVQQDCENGNVNKNRRVIPVRKDYYSPITRSTHMLYFQTYIYGQIKVTLQINYKVIITEVIKTEEGSETRTREQNVNDIQVYSNETLPTWWDSSNNMVNGQANLSKIGTTLNYNGKPIPHVLTVYGEDNGGFGRCLSADDSTALWYDSNGTISAVNSPSNPTLSGGIEIPLRVRFTPLVQPTITTNETVAGSSNNRTTWSNNIVSVKRSGSTVKESNSSNICSNLIGKSGLSVGISYGMYRSAMGGMYYSSPMMSNGKMQSQFHRLSISDENIIDNLSIGEPANTDMYPTVGICNAFMVLLYPTSLNEDYMHKERNWYANRANYEDKKLSSNKLAKPVIVADLAHDSGYIYRFLNNNDLLTSDLIDHNLQTRFNCNFDYNTLLYTSKVTSNVDNKKSRKNKLQPQVWYDLVVVPIFTNRDGFGSSTWKDMNFKINSESESATINGVTIGTTQDTEVDYYGSTPLVIKRFLQIAEVKSTSGGGGGGGTSPDDPEWVAPPFGIEPAIIFPNVNKVRYDLNGTNIKENPGFWLNNTFRVICRGPHFRSIDTINLSDNQATSEVSLESISGGQLVGPENEGKYQLSDIMIHIGKYDDPVYVCSISYDDNGNEVVKFTQDTYKDEEGKSHTYKFDSVEFTDAINAHAMDKEWLNARGLYTMRTNPTAFSKCTPEAKRSGDDRDVIYGGSLDSNNSESYASRFFVFNPSMVDAHTCYPEGYYIQMRFLNAEYPSSSQGGMWSEWYGGINNDNGYKEATNSQHSDLNYYVPVRDYSKVFTQFRGIIKESTIGSNVKTTEKIIPKDQYTNETFNQKLTVKGMGSLSPNMGGIGDEISLNPYYIGGEGNYHKESRTKGLENADTKIVPDKYLDNPYIQMINVIISNGENADISDKYELSNEVMNKHQQLWEMCYVDYIIRSMAKLYYSDWSEANIPQLGNYKLSPTDIGWTRALSYLYSDMLDTSTADNKWRHQAWVDSVAQDLNLSSMPMPKQYNEEVARWDVTTVITGITCDLSVTLTIPKGDISKFALAYNGGIISSKEAINSKIRVAAQSLLASGTEIWFFDKNDTIICKTAMQPNGICLGPSDFSTTPALNAIYNVNRYFRKDITIKDFDSLLQVLKNMVGFIRETKFTGKTTYSTDPTDYSGNGSGMSVLPVSPESLDWNRLNKDRTIIGHSLNMNEIDLIKGNSQNDLANLVDSNYIQQLYEAVVQKVAVPSIKILS